MARFLKTETQKPAAQALSIKIDTSDEFKAVLADVQKQIDEALVENGSLQASNEALQAKVDELTKANDEFATAHKNDQARIAELAEEVKVLKKGF